jgi:hypothetical protein
MSTINESALTLGKVCAACGKERKSKALGYDPQTFKPYCENPYICGDDHPNSVQNIIKRQAEVHLITAEEANEGYRKHLFDVYDDPAIVQRIQRMLASPVTMRIQDPEMAKFLIEFEAEQGLNNLSDTIRYCVQIVKENRGQFVNEHRQAAEEDRKEKTAAAVVAEIESPKKPETSPKKVDTDDFGTF